MKREAIFGLALLAGCAGLSACSTVDRQAVLTNLQGCERHYNGTVSAGLLTPNGFQGAVKIDCAPKGEPVAP